MNNSLYGVTKHINEILYMLDKAESDLKNARTWGIFDLFGGETITSLVKHRNIKKAEKHLKNIEDEISLLQTELKQVSIPVNTNIQTGLINKFMDIVVDHPLSDLYTQSKIKNGLSNIKSIRKVLEELESQLNSI